MYLNIKKTMSDKPTVYIRLNSEKPNSFPLRSGTGQGRPLAISTAGLEILGRVIRPEKETKGIKSERRDFQFSQHQRREKESHVCQ